MVDCSIYSLLRAVIYIPAAVGIANWLRAGGPGNGGYFVLVGAAIPAVGSAHLVFLPGAGEWNCLCQMNAH